MGFDGAPRVIGFDDVGREILTWVDGEAPGFPWPAWMQTDGVLTDLGVLLRRYHEAVATFVAPVEAPGGRGWDHRAAP